MIKSGAPIFEMEIWPDMLMQEKRGKRRTNTHCRAVGNFKARQGRISVFEKRRTKVSQASKPAFVRRLVGESRLGSLRYLAAVHLFKKLRCASAPGRGVF